MTVESGRETGSSLSGNETERTSGLSSSNSSNSPCSSNSLFNNRETGSPNLETGPAGDGSLCSYVLAVNLS